MAVMDVGAERALLASDMLLDGVHFDTSKHDLRLIGRKAIACNLSDCAAMAVRPLAAVVSVAFPVDWSLSQAQKLLEGMFAIAADFDLAIVGGDTASWKHPLAIDVAITAVPYDGIEPMRRSGAKVGDTLCVTGALGGSLLGHHLTFSPRVREAKALATALGPHLHAMMDISDGLALDLWRMCRASRTGAVLDESQLQEVVSAQAQELAARDQNSPLEHVLSDGEDFELLLSIGGGTEPNGRRAAGGVALYPVGTVTEDGLRIRRADGRMEDLEPRGYVH